MGKKCYAANTVKYKHWNAKQGSQQLPQHKTDTKKQEWAKEIKQSQSFKEMKRSFSFFKKLLFIQGTIIGKHLQLY